MWSSKFSIPRLRRVTPMPRIASSLPWVSVPGSHSKVISSAFGPGGECGQPAHQALELRASTGRTACRLRSTRSRAGVPRSRAARWYSSHSRTSVSRYCGDVAGVLVGVDAEIAEVAALAAEGNVQVEAQRQAGRGRCRERRPSRGGDGLLRPDGERRVVGDEVAADLGLLHSDAARALDAHQNTIYERFGRHDPHRGRLLTPAPRG